MAIKTSHIGKWGMFIAAMSISTSSLWGQTVSPSSVNLHDMAIEEQMPESEHIDRQFAALRTNLLADIVGALTIGVEVPIADRYSVAGDFAYAYTRIGNRAALQAIQGTVEGRYWFRSHNEGRNKLTGWNVGVYATYNSRFDVQWGGGWQGDGYFSTGVSGGYSLPITNFLNLDFSVMGGYFYSPEIRKYSKPSNGHLIWEQTRYNVSRVALTQVRVNLVWLINKRKCNR